MKEEITDGNEKSRKKKKWEKEKVGKKVGKTKAGKKKSRNAKSRKKRHGGWTPEDYIE